MAAGNEMASANFIANKVITPNYLPLEDRQNEVTGLIP